MAIQSEGGEPDRGVEGRKRSRPATASSTPSRSRPATSQYRIPERLEIPSPIRRNSPNTSQRPKGIQVNDPLIEPGAAEDHPRAGTDALLSALTCIHRPPSGQFQEQGLFGYTDAVTWALKALARRVCNGKSRPLQPRAQAEHSGAACGRAGTETGQQAGHAPMGRGVCERSLGALRHDQRPFRRDPRPISLPSTTATSCSSSTRRT